MYKTTDKIIRCMMRKFIRLFQQFKNDLMLQFDELNVMLSSRELYEKLDRIALDGYMQIAREVYKKQGMNEDDITGLWISNILLEYNPVTKYVYYHEVDRKRSRFAESVISTIESSKQNLYAKRFGKMFRANISNDIDTALRHFSNMAAQYAIMITDRAVLKAYEEKGITRVIWATVEDERRCKKCRERDGNVYLINEIPPKPHWGCRCWLLPYHGD